MVAAAVADDKMIQAARLADKRIREAAAAGKVAAEAGVVAAGHARHQFSQKYTKAAKRIRKAGAALTEQSPDEEEEEDQQAAAAIMIQTVHRGKQSRKAYAAVVANNLQDPNRALSPRVADPMDAAAATAAAEAAVGAGMASSALLDAGEDVEEIFDRLDVDRSGKLDFAELQKLVQQIGADITDKDLAATIQTNDADGDGTLSKPEVLEMMRRHAENTTALAAECAALKATFDTSGEIARAARAACAAGMQRAAGYVRSPGWSREISARTDATPTALVFTQAAGQAQVVKTAVAPFKTSGVVTGVWPIRQLVACGLLLALLAVFLLVNLAATCRDSRKVCHR